MAADPGFNHLTVISWVRFLGPSEVPRDGNSKPNIDYKNPGVTPRFLTDSTFATFLRRLTAKDDILFDLCNLNAFSSVGINFDLLLPIHTWTVSRQRAS